MGHVLLLALDTSSPSGSVAALRDGQLIGVLATRTDEDYSSRLFRHIEWLLKELSVDLGRFDAFAVSSGPGSFTGLRVGLAAVKGWAEVYGRPIVAVSGLEAVAAQSRAASQLLVPMLDARRGEVYFGLYRRQETEAGRLTLAAADEPQVMPPKEFLRTMEARAKEQNLTVVTSTPGVLVEHWLASSTARRTRSGFDLEAVSPLLAPVIGELGWKRLQAGETDSALTLEANYVRRTDAELKWKDPGIEDSRA